MASTTEISDIVCSELRYNIDKILASIFDSIAVKVLPGISIYLEHADVELRSIKIESDPRRGIVFSVVIEYNDTNTGETRKARARHVGRLECRG